MAVVVHPDLIARLGHDLTTGDQQVADLGSDIHLIRPLSRHAANGATRFDVDFRRLVPLTYLAVAHGGMHFKIFALATVQVRSTTLHWCMRRAEMFGGRSIVSSYDAGWVSLKKQPVVGALRAGISNI